MADVLLVPGNLDASMWFADDQVGLPANWLFVKDVLQVNRYVAVTCPELVFIADDLVGDEKPGWFDDTRVVVVGQQFETNRFQSLLEMGVEDYVIAPLTEAQIHDFLGNFRVGLSLQASKRQSALGKMVIGLSPDMVSAVRTASLVARSQTAVLIRGESGTGKELLAREIHRLSNRFGDLVSVNCAAVSESLAESELFGHERGAFTGAVSQRQGCFELAHGGTLFLDEIGDAPTGFQSKLLRVLDMPEFTRVGGQKTIFSDARIVAATNSNLEQQIETGAFRLDLFYRLGAVTIDLPPLRKRKADLPDIIRFMILHLNRKLGKDVQGVSVGALEQLIAHSWPGNLRELNHVLHRAVLLCRRELIEESHLQGLNRSDGAELVHIPTLSQIEETHIAHVMDITAGNKGRACDILGISRPTLRRKLRQYALEMEPVTT